MLVLKITKRSEKFVKKLLPKHARQIKEKIRQLLENPEPNDSRELVGHALRRVDVGEYRIIYRAEKETLFIFLIGKRNDAAVYKQLSRV